MIAQISTLTMTALKLNMAEQGPVGPSLSASTTNSSAHMKKAPAGRPVLRVSLFTYSLRGIYMTPKADISVMHMAQKNSINRFCLRKVKDELTREQYFAMLIREPRKIIEMKASITMILIAWCCCS